MFVTKKMKFADWPVFQGNLAETGLTLGAPADFALLYRSHNGVQVMTIAASGLDLSHANALSPGGWSEVEHLDKSRWALLVGHGDVHTRLGVHISQT